MKPRGYWKLKENREQAASECKSRTIVGELDEFETKFNWNKKHH